MKFKMLLCCVGALTTAVFGSGVAPEPTLDLKLDKASEITVETRKFDIKGEFRRSADKSGLATGKEYGISLPASKFFGPSGTLFFRFQTEKPQTLFKVPRYMLTLRGKERTWIGFSRYPGSNQLYVNFRYIGQNYYMRTPESLQFGKWYTAACTWNGEKVRFYLDGVPVAEQEQKVPAEFPPYSKLHIGPFKDGYVTLKPWGGNDILINQVMAFDKSLSPAEVAAISGLKAQKKTSSVPQIVIPQVSSKIVLDGALNDNPWNQAASFITLLDGNKPSQSLTYPENNVFFCYDKDNLYIGFRALFPRMAQIAQGTNNGKETEVWPDESFELYISHNGLYRFAGNVAGGATESLNTNNTFNGQWTYKSTLKMQIDDRELWEGEIAIPFKTIGMETPVTGQSLRLDFCRTWRALERVGLTSLSGGTSYGKADMFAIVKFGTDSPALQELKHNNPNFGDFSQTLRASSPKAGTYIYSVTLEDSAGMTPSSSLMQEQLQLEPGTTKTLTLNGKINKTYYNSLNFCLKDAQTSQILMQQSVPFKIAADYFSVKPAFTFGKVLICPRIELLKNKLPENAEIVLQIKSPEGKIIASKKLNSDAETSIEFDRNNLPGQYEAILISSNGKQKEVQTRKTFFYPGIGEWEKPQYSTADILPPFTPMKSSGSKGNVSVEMWGRVYNWTDSLFPAAITSSGQAMLDGTVSLSVNGKNVLSGNPELTMSSPARCELTASADDSNCKVENKAWIEYDGVLWNKVNLLARKSLNSVKLQVKVPASIGRFLHAGAGGFGASGGFTADVQSQQKLKFYPVIWLGNQERGMCWFAESTNGWMTQNRQPIEIIKQANNTILEITLADKLNAGQSMQFSFGLIATPVKPLPRNYPLNTFNWYFPVKYNMSPPEAPTSYTILHSSRLGEGFADLYPEDMKSMRDSVQLAHSNQAKCIPYMDPVHLPDEYPTAVAYRDEWQMLPERHLTYKQKDKKHDLLWCCPASKGANFFLWKTRKMIQESNVDGIYFDFGQVRYCKNPIHGCDGRYPLLAMRNFYRGIADALVKAGKKDYLIILHASEAIQVPVFTFVTNIFDGEHFRQHSTDTFHNGKDILDTLTLTDFATEFSSLPWGITSSIYMPTDTLLKKYGGCDDQELYRFRMTKAFLAGSLIHDTIPAILRGHFGLMDKLIRIYSRFEVPKAKFMPYWNNGQTVKITQGKNIYASAYRHHSKPEVLLIVSQVSKEHVNQDVIVELNPAGFDLKELTTATEVLSADQPEYERLLQAKNRLRIPVKIGDYGVKFNGLDGNRIKLHLDYHSVAIIHIKGK